MPRHPKVPATQPSFDMWLYVRSIETDELAEQLDIEPRAVRRWRESISWPQNDGIFKLSEALGEPMRDVSSMILAGYDAKQETPEQRTVRLICAGLEFLATVSDHMDRAILEELVDRARRLVPPTISDTGRPDPVKR